MWSWPDRKERKAKVVIEASASKVPTKTFGTNENLSRKRMEDARARLLEAVAERGKDAGPNSMLEAVNSWCKARLLGGLQQHGQVRQVPVRETEGALNHRT
jgi:hypothetical protein